uniref:Uncharacterized protein n=1 Tax=Anguilla anguilla TaxID=7936 RepID=A0A0E9TFF5_ANGAN
MEVFPCLSRTLAMAKPTEHYTEKQHIICNPDPIKVFQWFQLTL